MVTKLMVFGNVLSVLRNLNNVPIAPSTIPKPKIKVVVGNALIVPTDGNLAQ